MPISVSDAIALDSRGIIAGYPGFSEFGKFLTINRLVRVEGSAFKIVKAQPCTTCEDGDQPHPPEN